MGGVQRAEESAASVPRASMLGRLPLVPLSLVVGTVLVHPIRYILEHPFWYDESWVAVGTMAPLSYMPAINYPGPTGWALLLRLPWPGEQGMRLLTLAFSAAGVAAAYFLAGSLDWGSKRARVQVGVLSALAVMVSPWALTRNDLKSYTADAFFAMLLLWMAGRVEKEWNRRHLLELALVASVASLLSWASMFVTVAVFGALAVLALAQRDRGAIRAVVIYGFVVGIVFGLVYLVFLRPFDGAVDGFWEPYFLTGGPSAVARTAWWRFLELMGVYPGWVVWFAIPMFLLGWWTIARRRPATAMAMLLLGLLMVVLGLMAAYPFLDRRTSHFLLMIFVALAGIGLGSVASRVGKHIPFLGTAIFGVFAIGVVLVGAPYFNNPSLWEQDVRSQARYVQEHRQENDVVLVERRARFGFGYYWRGGTLQFDNRVNFVPRVVDDGVILYQLGPIVRSLEEAVETIKATGEPGRVWVVRTARHHGGWDEGYSAIDVVPGSLDVGLEALEFFDVEP